LGILINRSTAGDLPRWKIYERWKRVSFQYTFYTFAWDVNDIADFPGVQAIYLEENYRSTGSILAAAHSVVTQGKSRSSTKMTGV